MATPDQAALSVENLHVHYGPSHVLQGLNLDVGANEILAIVGRNGVGKTTLIKTIMGLLPVTEGRITLRLTEEMEELSGRPPFDRKPLGVAIVPQGRQLFRSLTVAEHLNLVTPIRTEPYDLDAIYTMFPRLYERRRAHAITLSGGEQSMLAIARALILNPRLLLMDEPTEGLAPLLVQAIAEIIVSLRDGGLTVLLVEQKLKFALHVSDRIAVMERGQIVGLYPQAEIDDVRALSELILHGAAAR